MVVVIAGAGVFSKDFCIKASLFIVAVAFVLADTSPVFVQKSAGVFSPGTDKVDSAVNFCGSEYHFHDANETTENIGARRLYTVMERLLEEVSFEAADHTGQTLLVDGAYVDAHLDAVVQDEDLSRFIL